MQTTIGNSIEKAAQLLADGQIVAIPTETVYGLAGNALEADIVQKIFEAKNRPAYNPLIVHIAQLDDLTKYAAYIPDLAYDLAQVFMPGPLTLLLPKKALIPDIVTANLPLVGLRMPNHPVSLSLLQQLNFPLAAPSANPFQYISPTTTAHVYQQLQGKIPYILEGGPCAKGIESTIIGFDAQTNQPILYRQGALPLFEIEKIAGKTALAPALPSNIPLTPGQLRLHYSPRTPLLLTHNLDQTLANLTLNPNEQIGIIAFTVNTANEAQLKATYPQIKYISILSNNGNLDEAAYNLYNALHLLDSMGLNLIIAQYAPNYGIGIAINDRLTRASRQ